MDLPTIDDNHAKVTCNPQDNLNNKCKFFATNNDSYVCLKHTKYGEFIKNMELGNNGNLRIYPMGDNCTGILPKGSQIPVVPDIYEDLYMHLCG